MTESSDRPAEIRARLKAGYTDLAAAVADVEWLTHNRQWWVTFADSAEKGRYAAEDAIKRVRAVHDGQTCADRVGRDDSGNWMCDTRRALGSDWWR